MDFKASLSFFFHIGMAREQTELLILDLLLEEPVMSSKTVHSRSLCYYLQLGAAPPEQHT